METPYDPRVVVRKVIELTRGRKKNKKENCEEVLKLYEQSMEYIIHAIKHEAKSESDKNYLRIRYRMYRYRIKLLKSHLEKKELANNLADRMSQMQL